MKIWKPDVFNPIMFCGCKGNFCHVNGLCIPCRFYPRGGKPYFPGDIVWLKYGYYFECTEEFLNFFDPFVNKSAEDY